MTAPASLAEALAQLQGQLPGVAKKHKASVTSQRTGKTHSYDYADLPDVSDALLPVMAVLGLSFTAFPTMHEGQFVLRYTLRHMSGESETGLYPLPGSGSPQDIGSAISYARRYALTGATGLAPGGDDDGKAATDAHHARKPRTAPDTQLDAEGRMTRAQLAGHKQLEADTKRQPQRAARTRPAAPEASQWDTSGPVDTRTGERDTGYVTRDRAQQIRRSFEEAG